MPAVQNLEQLGSPLGWQAMPNKTEWPNIVIGLLLTSIAVSMGAPFWFDLLNRIIKIRSTGNVPEPAAKKNEE